MNLRITLTIIYVLIFLKPSLSQNIYTIKSVTDLLKAGSFLIKLHNENDSIEKNEIWLVSNSNYIYKVKNLIKVNVGMHLNLFDLIEIPKTENPYYLGNKLYRKTDGVVYIDGIIVYDPNIKQYSSKCLQGLYYNLDCKCKKKLFKRCKLFLKKKSR